MYILVIYMRAQQDIRDLGLQPEDLSHLSLNLNEQCIIGQ